MAEPNQGDYGDRQPPRENQDVDLLRNVLMGDQLDSYRTKINELEEQISWVQEEMRAQGQEMQNVLEDKINEVLQAIQVSHFERHPPASPPNPPITPIASPIPTPESAPPPIAAPVTPPAPEAPRQQFPDSSQEKAADLNANIDFFSQQINAILGEQQAANSEAETVGPESAPPLPPPQQPPPEAPAPVLPPSPASQLPLPVIAEDEATQIQNLRNVLRDEDVMQLRQINDKLDYKLRQVEEYIAASQQPINNLLPLMAELVELRIKEAKSQESTKALPSRRKPTPWGIIFAFLMLLILIPLGLYGYWWRQKFLQEREVAIALQGTPELALYRLAADVEGGKLYLTGTLPSETLRERAGQIAQGTAPTLALNNNIVAAEPPNPEAQQAEIDQILQPLNGINGIDVTATLDGDRLVVAGTVLQEGDIATIMDALAGIDGIGQITNNIQVQAQPIRVRLYFDQNSAAIKPSDVDQKLAAIKAFLQQYPTVNLRLIGYQHPTESANDIALKRAQSTQILLQDQGIDRRRILALGVNQSPPDITANDPIWLSRTVIFETVLPKNETAE